MTEFKHWDKIGQTGLSDAKIEQLIEACKMAHSDFFSIGLACGIRAAFRMLAEMGGDRAKHAINSVSMQANACVSIAFIVIACVNPCKNTLDFNMNMAPDWEVTGRGGNKQVYIKMKNAKFKDADAVFAAADSELFEIVEISEVPA